MDDIPPLDEFSRLYPLPYRLATLIILGIALWGFNLSVLKRKYDIVGSRIMYTRANTLDTGRCL